MRAQEIVVNNLFDDFDKLTVPVSAFITFEEEDGKIFALRTTSSSRIIGQDFRFKGASEPTDIIWENRHFTKWDYFKRQTFAYIIIAILLLGSFIVVFIVAKYSAIVSNRYPGVQCESIFTDYGVNLEGYAYDDWTYV
jgi:hypothetical protein